LEVLEMKKKLVPILFIVALLVACGGGGDSGRSASIEKLVKNSIPKEEATTIVDDAIKSTMETESKSKKEAQKSVLENVDKLVDAYYAKTISDQDDGDTAELKDATYYKDLPDIQFTTIEETPRAAIIKLQIGYKTGNADAEKELQDKSYDVAEYLRNYLSSKVAADLSVENKGALKVEIMGKLNEYLTSKGVIDIKFEKLRVIQF
jgi:flagellar basal body-associated protein FliL